MSEEKILEEQVAFGAEVVRFLESPIGKYIMDRAADEVDAAVQELKRVDPEYAKEIRRLQAIIERNESVGLWLQEAMQAAMDARALLAGEEP